MMNWIDLQAQTFVRTGGESGRRGAVKFLCQTEEGKEILGSLQQQDDHDEPNAINAFGDYKVSYGPNKTGPSPARSSSGIYVRNALDRDPAEV